MSKWPKVALGEVTECLDRQRVPVKESERAEGNIPYYGANGQQGWIDRPIFNEPLVLVAEDGGHFAEPSRGVAYKIDGPSWINNHAHVLRPRSEHLHVDFLRRVLENYDFCKYISGSTRSKLNQKQLNSATIPLPPLDEQRHIAAILDKADELRTKRREAIAKLDTLAQSIFIDMFGDPAKNPLDWSEVALSDITELLSGFAFKSAQFGDEIGLPVVRIRDVKRGYSETYFDGEYDPKYIIGDGDLLIGMDGEFNRETWSGGQALLNQRVCKLEADQNSLDQRYLHHFLPRQAQRIPMRLRAVAVHPFL